MSTSKNLSTGLAEQAQLIQWHVGVWHDLGYPEPLPSPDCHPVPPLGERPAGAIKGGHDAIRDIDELTRQLHELRRQLVSELRQDEDIRAVRVDTMLAAEPPQVMCAACVQSAHTRRPDETGCQCSCHGDPS